MHKEKLRLLVVIINYKTPQLVCQAVQSVVPQLNSETDKICIVDNDSHDGSVEILQQFISTYDFQSLVKIIASPFNCGFSAGNNIGFQAEKADYYLLLNSDAFVRDNAIKLLLLTAKLNPKVGLIGPRLEWPDGSQQVSCFYNLTPVNSFLHSAKTGFLTRLFKFFSVNEVAISIERHNAVKPDWISFACVLLRAEMVNDVGLMDEGYFMYREDNDYCRRVVALGWQLKYEDKARVVHLNNGDSNQSLVRRLPDYYFKSRSRYFLKYYGRKGLFLANLSWALGRIISLARESVERKTPVFHSRMWLDIWSGFLAVLNKNEN